MLSNLHNVGGYDVFSIKGLSEEQGSTESISKKNMSDQTIIVCMLAVVLSICYTIGSLSVYYSQHPGGPDDCYYHGSDDLSGLDLMNWLLITGIWTMVGPTLQALAFVCSDDGFFIALGIEVMSGLFSLIMFGMGMSLITEYTEDSCKQTPGWDMALTILIFQGVTILKACLGKKEK